MHTLDPLIPTYIDTYFARIYPLCRAVDRSAIYQRLAHRAHFTDRQFASLILATAAFTALVPESGVGGAGPEAEANADFWMREAIQLHSTAALGLGPTGHKGSFNLDSLATSILIGSYLRAVGWCDAAYMRTQESLGLLEVLHLQDSSGYDGMAEAEKEAAITMYWIVRVAERSNALIERRPVSIRTSIIGSHSGRGQTVRSAQLEPIVTLFDCVDPDTIDCANGSCATLSSNGYTTDGIGKCAFDSGKAIALHARFDAIISTDEQLAVQKADLTLTRVFMHTVVWQTCVSHSALVFGAPLVELRLEYPLLMLAAAVEGVRAHGFESMRGNGKCLGKKLRYVADTADMVLRLQMNLPLVQGVPSQEEARVLLIELRAAAEQLITARWMRFDKPVVGPQVMTLPAYIV